MQQPRSRFAAHRIACSAVEGGAAAASRRQPLCSSAAAAACMQARPCSRQQLRPGAGPRRRRPPPAQQQLAPPTHGVHDTMQWPTTQALRLLTALLLSSGGLIRRTLAVELTYPTPRHASAGLHTLKIEEAEFHPLFGFNTRKFNVSGTAQTGTGTPTFRMYAFFAVFTPPVCDEPDTWSKNTAGTLERHCKFCLSITSTQRILLHALRQPGNSARHLSRTCTRMVSTYLAKAWKTAGRTTPTTSSLP
jgi:hypothetical protein